MNKVIVITGPTAVGKTTLSIALAKYFNGEIINADSTQIFKGLDIATAKVTKEEREEVPHHLIDIKEVTEEYSVYDYQKDCRRNIKELSAKGKTPILVGGTGLYINAALYDYRFSEENNQNQYEEVSTEELYQKLLDLDPKTDIHPNNRKRIIRSLNYCDNLGETELLKNKDELLYDAVFIGLTTSREILYERINTRVDIMMELGLIQEAKQLYDQQIRTKAIMTPIGYKELFEYFDGTSTLEESISLIKQRSRRYAKRQYTWFRHQMKLQWFEVDFNDFEHTVQEVIHYIEEVNK